MPERYLLDTHVLLWVLFSPERIPERVRERLIDPYFEVYFSAASVWEIAIKAQIGRLKLTLDLNAIVEAAEDSGFEPLAIRTEHATKIIDLPLYHRDPFDRILVAQAIVEKARLLTADSALIKCQNVELI